MQSSVSTALERLNAYLPLASRQARLPGHTRDLHRDILNFLFKKARAPVAADFGNLLPAIPDLEAQLRILASHDLLVLDQKTGMPLGAYPLTSEKTPHQILIGDRCIHAMCALDAVSVASMFVAEVKIASSCQLTGIPIYIRMQDKNLLEVLPDHDCQIGIRWQSPGAVAAYSMCMQMVFLRNAEVAKSWRNNDADGVSLLGLHEAISLGASFFCPLMSSDDSAGNTMAEYGAVF